MKKVISLLLALLMMVSLLPISVFAEAKDTCVWVNGEQFTSEKLTISCGDGTATYDPATATLTLNNATITQTHEFTDEVGYKHPSAIYAKGDLKVNRVGESRIEPISDAATYGYGIYVEGELVITGTGDLEIPIDGRNCGTQSRSLTISGSGSVNIDTGNCGVYTDYLTVKDSVDVTVHGDEYGVFTRNGSVTLLGSGDVFISGDENGVVLWDDCTVQLNGTGNLKITAGSGKKAVCNEDNPESLVTLQNPVNYVVTGTPDSDYVYYEYSPFRNLWVNGEQFTSEKLTIECGSGTATYDPVTATVTLNNATITQTHADSGFSGAIYAGRDITLNVVGDSSISLGEYANGVGIYTAGNLTIRGDKALNITIENEYGYGNAVWVNGGNLTVDMEGNLTATSTGTALSATKNITLSGNGNKTINAGADANGIYSSGGDITLSGNGNVTIDAGCGIYAQTKNAELAGSGNIVINSKTSGFNVIGDLTIGGSGKLTVDAGSYGLLCCNMIFTGERTADITAGEAGIVPAGEVELGGSGDITITAEEYGINVYYNGDVNISGSGKLTVTAGYKGIVSYNGAILSGSGEVEIYGKENAVYFDNEQGAVRLNGTGSPITLRADQGKKAVYNITTHQSPVAGTAFDDYKCVTGAPDTSSVVYTLKSAPVTYTIIAGVNGEWTKGSTAGLAFTSDAPFAKFKSVQVDGSTIAATNYAAEEGSTKITLTPAYLETLNVGSHSIKIVSSDGSASTNFNVTLYANWAGIPKTGDNSNMFLWLALLLVSGGALAGTSTHNKKKKKMN